MPTRKQRRRREKGRRHEYEYVYVDDEGREVDADEAAAEPERPAKTEPRKGERRERAQRTIQPPSWRRVVKRALIFAPLMFVMISLLDPQLNAWQRGAFTLQMAALFVPFSYLVDRMTYRAWQRRLARADGGSGGRRR